MNIGNIKALTEIIFFINLTKNLAKGLSMTKKYYQYDVFTNVFRMILNKHVSIKKKIVRR